jgi:hypothetical protein
MPIAPRLDAVRAAAMRLDPFLIFTIVVPAAFVVLALVMWVLS